MWYNRRHESECSDEKGKGENGTGCRGNSSSPRRRVALNCTGWKGAERNVRLHQACFQSYHTGLAHGMNTGFAKIKNSLNEQQKHKSVGLSKWKIVAGY